LEFDLAPESTLVTTRLQVVRRDGEPADVPLELDGEDLELVGIAVDGVALDASRYVLSGSALAVSGLPARASLEIVSRCRPAENSTLMGLYVSGQSLFTQCEAQGFRRIAWFADRPDVMSRYRVIMRADKGRYPVLLSNG